MPGTDLSSNVNHAPSPTRARFTWRLLIAPALAAAFALAAPSTATAQDIGPGKSKPAKKAPAKPAKKAPAKPAKKAPAKPAKKAPAKAPAKKAPAAKAPAVPAAKVPAAKAPVAPAAKKSLDGGDQKAPAAKPAVGDDGAKAAAPAIKSLSEGFETILAPHGTWVEDEAYGKLWIPNEKEVGKHFAPYRTGGRWAATDDGSWSWVSDYKWGNVPFHYGRWLWTKDKKWAWSPGETYAPAWVIWRVGDAGYDFVGWAPMAPEPKPVKKAPAAEAGKAAKKELADDAKAKTADADEKSDAKEPATKAAPKTKVLPFYFVANKHLFLQSVEKYVLTDRKLGHAVQKHSEIYEGNRIEGRKGFFKPATPTFSEIRVPAFAIPRSRLSALAKEVAPLTLDAVRGLAAAVKPAPATEPPAPAKATEPAAEKAAPVEKEKPAKRSFATPPPAKGDDGKTRYRCWWTNSRPRIWRCGY